MLVKNTDSRSFDGSVWWSPPDSRDTFLVLKARSGGARRNLVFREVWIFSNVEILEVMEIDCEEGFWGESFVAAQAEMNQCGGKVRERSVSDAELEVSEVKVAQSAGE